VNKRLFRLLHVLKDVVNVSEALGHVRVLLTELYSTALSLCVVLEQFVMLPIVLGGIQ
jgi:hypothetical protein